jgi:apolipoprotein D and lipocalin family protein
MLRQSLLFIVGLAMIKAQVPSFGRCPEFDAMPAFNKERFLGTWYEIERYFTVTEVVSKCISADYERRADGKIYVNNHYTNRM